MNAFLGALAGRPTEPVVPPADLPNLERALALVEKIEAIRAANPGRAGNALLREPSRELQTELATLGPAAQKGIGEYQAALRAGGGQVTAEAERIANQLRSSLEITVKPIVDSSSLTAAETAANSATRAVRALGTAQRAAANANANSAAASIPVQARAKGGPYRAGLPLLVGERGPELLMPKVPGHVFNAVKTASMLQPRARSPHSAAALGSGAPSNNASSQSGAAGAVSTTTISVGPVHIHGAPNMSPSDMERHLERGVSRAIRNSFSDGAA
ncbi:hypothetical protein RDV64_19825 [Acuticoccus sp. MNP-M23]|uniref:hypothetical protein n=1 Tax=Acuticoccus sp. MNP-M23 TaxID=3072793 RepID=UPI00281698C0|nr:hypothetical protein [Acuticoccus sp. MNP-M23]WMS42287.1 hypothetical protein RDV64_19825 [Acuticoccus sp. MNP-M23]